MANVRITRRLLDEVADKIHRLERVAMNAHNKNAPNMQEMLADFTPKEILEAAWGEHYSLMLTMPDKWMVYPSTLRFVDAERNVLLDRNNNFSSVALPFPPGCSQYTTQVEVPAEHPAVKAAAEHDAGRAAIAEQYRVLFTNVIKTLESYPTLNRALGANPELRHVVPDEFLQAVARIEERKPREKKDVPVPVELDKGALVAAVSLTSLAE